MELADAIRKARRVYIVGNGGSYANACHIQNDLESCGIRAHTLSPASLTATANDDEYGTIFSKWITVHGERGDLLIALSGSGKSRNILAALDAAREIGMTTWAIFGAYNSAIFDADMADHLTLAGDDMQAAENEQIRIGHEVMRCLKSS